VLPENVKLVLQLDNDLPSIFADPGYVDRILTNLVINAKDAMSEGGRITISTDLIQFDPAVPNSGQIENIPYLHLKVSDTGMGMDEATRQHAFEPFFTTKPKGTGLGLATVHKILEIHDAKIFVESHEGQGTEFTIQFHQEGNQKSLRSDDYEGQNTGS